MLALRAIDSTGKLGSFYDRYRNYVLEESITTNREVASQKCYSMKCKLINGKMEETRNLLKAIGISDDLRLSIQLDPKLRTGVAALVDHTYPINKYTRFLYFYYTDREQRLPDDPTQVKKWIKSSMRSGDATHIITAVSFGIDAFIVLQLPNDRNICTEIDDVLKKIEKDITEDEKFPNLNQQEKNRLRNIFETTVYSNIDALNKMKSILDICQYLSTHLTNPDMHTPLTYTLQPIKWLYPVTTENCTAYISIEENTRDKLEQHLIELSNRVKQLKYSIRHNLGPLYSQHLQKQLDEMCRRWQNLKKLYEDEIRRIRDLIIDIRNEQMDASKIDEAFTHENQSVLKHDITELTVFMNDLEQKGKMITQLVKEHFDYCNAVHYDINEHDSEQTWRQKLLANDQYDEIFCCNDRLKKENPSKWETYCCQLADKRKQLPDFRILYADFSYCNVDLHDMVILLTPKQDMNYEKFAQQRNSSRSITQQSSVSSRSVEIMNILLIGESGVGKSTFINALINYLKFKSFREAERNKPIVLISVSFLITTGRNFDEHIVKFGDFDNSNNEDFNHPGQSVTQQCRSYVFNLDNNNERKLRIIDTPGFGDTRGLNQDDINMQNILEYINNLTHLNAVCFLLKPNASELHTFFRMCFTQLIDLLGPNIRDNIIFCFTNARSTFYTPGDTAPLLKTMLKSLTMTDIQFKKENTFCFDNESFRYLVAVQDGVIFDNDEEKNEYKMSWSTSVKESNRLINYIGTQLNTCQRIGEQQSIKDAQFQILLMIRPILEAMRNTLRNIILWNMNTTKKSIELIPGHLSCPIGICSICKDVPLLIGPFWIHRNVLHNSQNECHSCRCPLDQHITIYYKLNYEYSDSSSDSIRDETKNMLNMLCHASAEFAHFLMYVACSSKDDPFWIGIIQMISEENDLCNSQQSTDMNLQLAKDLRSLKDKYERRIEDMTPNQEHSKLSIIYDWIKRIHENPMVKVQMNAIRKTQQNMMELFEYEAPKHIINT